MILRRFLIVAWADRIIEIHLPTSPIAMSSTDASCIRRSIDMAPQVTKDHCLIQKMIALSSFGATCDGTDGAYSNTKYENDCEHEVRDKMIQGLRHENGSRLQVQCGSHQNRLVETYMKQCIDDDEAVDNLAKFISLLRSSGFFLRLISVVFVTVWDHLDFELCAKPAEMNGFAKVLMEHVLYYSGRFAAAVATKPKDAARIWK